MGNLVRRLLKASLAIVGSTLPKWDDNFQRFVGLLDFDFCDKPGR